MVLESSLENHFRKTVRALGGRAYKLAPTDKGMPDRMVIFPRLGIELVELKTETGRTSPAQDLWHARAASMGVYVTVLSGRAQIDSWADDRRQDMEGKA